MVRQEVDWETTAFQLHVDGVFDEEKPCIWAAWWFGYAAKQKEKGDSKSAVWNGGSKFWRQLPQDVSPWMWRLGSHWNVRALRWWHQRRWCRQNSVVSWNERRWRGSHWAASVCLRQFNFLSVFYLSAMGTCQYWTWFYRKVYRGIHAQALRPGTLSYAEWFFKHGNTLLLVSVDGYRVNIK